MAGLPDVTYDSKTYKLRVGGPMSKGLQGDGDFVVHTFMAEEINSTIYAYTETLPKSNEFRGQGGDLISGNFSRLSVKGGRAFSGKTTDTPIFIEEIDVP